MQAALQGSCRVAQLARGSGIVRRSSRRLLHDVALLLDGGFASNDLGVSGHVVE